MIAAAILLGEKAPRAIMANDISVVSPQGRLDSVTSTNFERDLLAYIESGATRVLIDFSKLDYITSLGVNTIWLLPFYPSPRLDDGYDISEYRDVDDTRHIPDALVGLLAHDRVDLAHGDARQVRKAEPVGDETQD